MTRVEENKVTFTRGVGKKKKEFSLSAAANCRVFVAQYDRKTKKIEAGDEIADGLKSPLLQVLGSQTVEAWIVTDAKNETIQELRLFQSVRKKSK